MLKNILDRLLEIEGQLDDAYYSLPEYNANSDGRSHVDSARSDLYSLKDDIEGRSLIRASKVFHCDMQYGKNASRKRSVRILSG